MFQNNKVWHLTLSWKTDKNLVFLRIDRYLFAIYFFIVLCIEAEYFMHKYFVYLFFGSQTDEH